MKKILSVVLVMGLLLTSSLAFASDFRASNLIASWDMGITNVRIENNVTENWDIGLNGEITEVKGVYGKAVEYSQPEARLGIIERPSMFENKSDITVAGWIKIDKYPQNGDVVSLFDKDGSLRIIVNEKGVVQSILTTTKNGWYTKPVQTGVNAIKLNVWHHIATTYNSTTGTHSVYINGNLAVSNNTFDGGFKTNETSAFVGKIIDSKGVIGTSNVKRTFDDICIYDKALTGLEISDIYGKSPLSYWDATINGTNLIDKGLASNELILGANVSNVKGVVGDALSLTGKSGAYMAKADSNFDLKFKEQLSISFWMKQDKLIGNNFLVDKNMLYRLTTNGAGLTFTMSLDNGGWYGTNLLNVSNVLKPNTWQHIAATYNGAFMKIYVDGVLVGEKAATGKIYTTSPAKDEPFYLSKISTTEDIICNLDEVQIFNKGLSAEDINNAIGIRPQMKWSGNLIDNKLIDDIKISDNLKDLTATNVVNTPVAKGKGYEFKSTASATLPHSDVFAGIKNLTLSTWLKLDYVSGDVFLFDKDLSFRLIVNKVGQIQFVLNTTNNPWYSTAVASTPKNTIEPNKLYHIAATYDGTKMSIYVNGEIAKETLGVSGAIKASGSGFIVGKSSDSTITRQIDEAEFYTVALNNSQIKELYQLNIPTQIKNIADENVKVLLQNSQIYADAKCVLQEKSTQDAIIILAIYDNLKLIDVKIGEPVTMTLDNESVYLKTPIATLPSDVKNVTAKAFVFDGLSTMKPLFN